MSDDCYEARIKAYRPPPLRVAYKMVCAGEVIALVLEDGRIATPVDPDEAKPGVGRGDE